MCRALAVVPLLALAVAAAIGGEPLGTVADAIAAQIAARRYAEAAEAARVAVAALDSAAAAESLEVARLLDLYVEASWRGELGDGATREDGERAVRIREARAGGSNAEVAQSLHLLANLVQGRGDFRGARALYERSLAIREQVFGADALEVVPSLNNLGNVTRQLADLPASVRYLERALAVRERRLAPDDPNLARSYVSLGNTLRELEQFDRAEELLRRAVAVLERGAPGQGLSSALNTLSAVLIRRGDLAEAEAIARRSVAVEEGVGLSFYLALYLGNLAVVRRDAGDFAEARRIQERALRIYEENPDPNEASLALLLNNLGHLFLVSGDPHGAEQPLARAMEIRRRVLPAGHPEIAQTLTNLGHARLQLGDVDAAHGLYQEAAAIVEASRGAEHLDYAEALIELGLVESAAQREERALERYRGALAIIEVRLGPDAPLTATALHHIGTSELRMKRHGDAERTFEQVLTRRERALGPAHPQVAEALAGLAYARAARGEVSRAFDLALRVEELGAEHVRLNVPVLPERQALALAASRPAGADVVLSIAVRSTEPHVVRRAWEAVLRARGLVLGELARQVGTARTRDEATEALAAELAEARGRLVQLHLSRILPERAAEHQRALAEARRGKERLEQALAEASSTFRAAQLESAAGWDDVASALPGDTALVAYVSFEDVLAAAAEPDRKSYAAFVAAPGRAPAIVALGPARTIDDLVLAWRQEVTAPATGGARPGAEARYRSAGEALRRAGWDPVRARLGRVRRVFVVPADGLHLVNLAALPAGSQGYVVESGPLLHVLTAERDLLRRRAAPGSGLLALGAPDFDLDLAGPSAPQARSSDAPGTEEIDVLLPRLRSATARFDPLPGAAAETSRVAGIWREARGSPESVVELMGAAATESAFKIGSAGRSVLHVATHGFFLQPEAAGVPSADHGTAVLGRAARSGRHPIAADNPLLLAGLALAGANRRLSGEAAVAGDDGLLVA